MKTLINKFEGQSEKETWLMTKPDFLYPIKITNLQKEIYRNIDLFLNKGKTILIEKGNRYQFVLGLRIISKILREIVINLRYS